ncbi:6343_t:CDS:2 [Ambispora gerdemannii]|uniref:propanoyl-CoA C-acyltransferase n=1 Tax=Ambispora gerdemannii TaxID=144530 RepID=A0A9N8Z3C2_9GLOM|nr:6343_t:CDS:2 [Ambispora gerdemannii]
MAGKQERAYVIGVGMTKFSKPQGRADYPGKFIYIACGRCSLLGREAASKALLDAGIKYDDIQQAIVGYSYGDSTCGQRILYQLGMTQIPIINVNNNGATGSTALFIARQLVEAGIIDCVLALGFEKMAPGSLPNNFTDRVHPVELSILLMSKTRGLEPAPIPAQIFGNAGIEYCEKYGATPDHMAKIAEKNHRHSANNPYSQLRDILSLDQIKSSPNVFGPLTKVQCCPNADGAAAAVLASKRFVCNHGLQGQAIEIVAQSLATDSPLLYEKKSSIELAGADMTRRAARDAFNKAGITPNDVQVVELHDCFSANELITYDALGLCKPGEAHKLIDAGDVTYGGKYVVNPSGGLISKGNPIGATGLAQCTELVWQLRGWCESRQVPNIQYALQHNIGLGGAAVVTIYKRAEGLGKPKKSQDPQKRFGYNPAIEIKPISDADFKRVCSSVDISEFALGKL